MSTASEQPEFDFDNQLPAGKEWFSPRWLARHWGKSVQHVLNLIEEGEIKDVVDMRSKHARRTCANIPRQSVVDFLNRRKK
jgi:hypothetical protein